MLMSQTPSNERPRERCLRSGAETLSLRECLALLIGTGPRGIGCLGLAARLLGLAGPGLPSEEEERALFRSLEVASQATFEAVPGLGAPARARLLAAFELARRYSRFQERALHAGTGAPANLPGLASSALGRVPPERRADPQEWLGFIPVHANRRIGGFCLLERGVRTHVTVDPAELFARLLAIRPKGFFLVHNHPSGDLHPSPPDLELTHRVREQAEAFEIRLLGHWIVTATGQKWIDALC